MAISPALGDNEKSNSSAVSVSVRSGRLCKNPGRRLQRQRLAKRSHLIYKPEVTGAGDKTDAGHAQLAQPVLVRCSDETSVACAAFVSASDSPEDG
jgi:hypothetical protein